MQIRRRIPARARFDFCRERARDFIRAVGIDQLPVDPFTIYENSPWLLLTYPQAKRVLHKRDPLSIRRINADARTKRWRDSGLCLTVYDATRRRERVRFTLAHEIGHIVLGHLSEFRETDGGGLTREQNETLEREANAFAAELLTPLPVLRAAGARTADDVMMLCDVSRQSAEVREGQLAHAFWRRYCESYRGFYETQFAGYLQPVAVCGNTRNMPPLGFQLERPEVPRMEQKQYLYIPTRGDGRFEFCPQCGNTVFSEKAEYCRMCGFHLYNECTNADEWVTASDCGHRFLGDARYCELCGAPTTLFRRGVLLAWDAIVQAGGNAADGIDPDDRRLYEKEAASAADDDEDMPF